MSQNAGAPVQPEKIDSIENEDGITIGESYLVRRADSSVCQAQVIQARMSEFGYFEYYVHYVGLNRRLDQWVQRSQLLSSSSPESLESPQTIRVSTDAPSLDQMTDDSSDRKITRNQKRRHDEINHVQKTYAEMDPTTGEIANFVLLGKTRDTGIYCLYPLPRCPSSQFTLPPPNKLLRAR